MSGSTPPKTVGKKPSTPPKPKTPPVSELTQDELEIKDLIIWGIERYTVILGRPPVDRIKAESAAIRTAKGYWQPPTPPIRHIIVRNQWKGAVKRGIKAYNPEPGYNENAAETAAEEAANKFGDKNAEILNKT